MTTQTNTGPKSNPVDALGAFLTTYGDHTASSALLTQRHALMLVLSVVQVVQRAFAGSTDIELQKALVAAIRSVLATPITTVPFPVMSTVLSNTYSDLLTQNGVAEDDKPAALLEAVFTFLGVIHDGGPATEAELRNIVATTWLKGGSGPQPAQTNYPEINFRANILKIFNPGHVASVDLEPFHVVIYRGELLGGGFGPELWGLAYIKDETAHLILETGEYLKVPQVSLTLAITKDYDTNELPAYLMACAKLFIPTMLSEIYNHDLPPELQQSLSRLDKNLGTFTTNPVIETVTPADISACETVIDRARWGADDKKTAGVMKAFSVAKSCFQVVVNAQQAAVRPFITASLVVAATGTVVMRLDTPREFSAHGIYLFPLAEKSTALIVV